MDIATACQKVMLTSDPNQKVMATRALARDWRAGAIAHQFTAKMPDEPARPANLVLLPPNKMPNRRRAGSVAGRIALIHALAHIEFVAIDLAIDIVGRFGASFGPAFVDDWLSVAADEALHFALLERHLRNFGSFYGQLPAHDGLWEAAGVTSHDVLARLAIVPMVLEARGLDVSPETILRLERVGDARAATIVTRIYRDEIRHVGIGTKWFKRIVESQGAVAENVWQSLVTAHFRGQLKPPFNDSARKAAGLTREFYDAIVLVT